MEYNVQTAAALIRNVYHQEGCEVGGIGHIVFDDYNVDDDNIEFCLTKESIDMWNLPEESLEACKQALEYLKGLHPLERREACMMA